MLSLVDLRTRSADPAERRGRRVSRPLSALRSRLYLPAFSVVAVAAALVAVGWADHWGGSGFGLSMASLRVVLIGPLTLAVIGVFLVVERVRPAQRRTLIARGHRQDVLFTVFNATLVVPLVTALSLSFSEIARRSLPWI